MPNTAAVATPLATPVVIAAIDLPVTHIRTTVTAGITARAVLITARMGTARTGAVLESRAVTSRSGSVSKRTQNNLLASAPAQAVIF